MFYPGFGMAPQSNPSSIGQVNASQMNGAGLPTWLSAIMNSGGSIGANGQQASSSNQPSQLPYWMQATGAQMPTQSQMNAYPLPGFGLPSQPTGMIGAPTATGTPGQQSQAPFKPQPFNGTTLMNQFQQQLQAQLAGQLGQQSVNPTLSFSP